MTKTAAQKLEMKQKAKHEAKELLIIFVYLAFFFCALITYTMLLMHDLRADYFSYGFALINALVIAKVILIGQMVNLGKKYEARPLLLSVLYKAFIFGLFVFAFHIVEEMIKGLVHGITMAKVFEAIQLNELIGRTIVVFCTFIPLFGFMEFRRVLGEEKFYGLLFHSEKVAL